jgi:hypothetical protein
MNNSITISLDHEGWDHKPSSKLQYKDWVDKFKNPRSEISVIGSRIGSNTEKVSPSFLAKAISQGRTWSPFTFNECPHWKRPRRIETLFKSCQVFAIDFDNGESTQDIKEKAKSLGIEFTIIHNSFSSTEETPKHRGIIFCEKEITNFDDARKYSIALAYAFDGDKQCIDAARLYFGSKPNSIIEVNRSSAISIEKLEEISKQTDAKNLSVVKASEMGLEKPESTHWGDSTIQKNIIYRLSKSKQKYVRTKVLGILKDVENFDGSKGSRYECVWKSTSRLARMPELVGSAVFKWMNDSIEKNPYFKDWDWDAESVVMNAIKWSIDHSDDPV